MGWGPPSAQEERRFVPSLGGIDDQQGHNFEEMGRLSTKD